ncbi:MAG: hypothetical protein NW220_20780 [Leptolyngbyaceae cyanobacterium bins.349]|nr:hypothetical protein [Leptolyngbyaceae cyanobacterium bins.349]
MNKPQLLGQISQQTLSLAASQADQCPIGGTWVYQSPGSFTYDRASAQYRTISTPYKTTVELTESNPRQDTVRDGTTERVVRIAVVKLSNADPAVQEVNARIQTGMRVGSDRSGFLLAVPIADFVPGGAALQDIRISQDCQKMQGQAVVAGTAKVSFTMERQAKTPANDNQASQAGCPSSKAQKRTYQVRTSLDNKQIEITSNLNERMESNFINPTRMIVDYLDCKGGQWQFRLDGNLASAASPFQVASKQLYLKPEANPLLSEKIDPVELVLCPSCQMMSTMNEKLKAAMGVDSSLNDQIPTATNITGTLFRGGLKPSITIVYQNLTNATQQASVKAIESVWQDKLFLEPIQGFFVKLSDAALGCSASLQGRCAAIRFDTPPVVPSPSPSPSSPTPRGDCPDGSGAPNLTYQEVQSICNADPNRRTVERCFFNKRRVNVCDPFRSR